MLLLLSTFRHHLKIILLPAIFYVVFCFFLSYSSFIKSLSVEQLFSVVQCVLCKISFQQVMPLNACFGVVGSDDVKNVFYVVMNKSFQFMSIQCYLSLHFQDQRCISKFYHLSTSLDNQMRNGCPQIKILSKKLFLFVI